MIHLLQVYRGFAALLVVFYHASARIKKLYGIEAHSFLDFFGFGDAGVQFFFVLSGFIIYHIHRKDIGREGRPANYLKKRIIRIYPIYIFVTLLVLPAWYFLPSIGFPYHQEFGALLFSLLLIPQDHAPHLAVAWTLSHEMLFYLLFAVVIFRRNLGALLFAGWFVAIGAANFTGGGTLEYPWDFFFNINNLLFGLGIGAAIVCGKFSPGTRQSTGIILAGALLFLLTGLLTNDLRSGDLAGQHLPAGVILLYGLASFLLVLPASDQGIENRVRKRKLMILAGDASYSIYLIHVPALSFIVRAFTYLGLEKLLPFPALFILAALLAAVAGVLLHWWVEKPLLRYFRAKWLSRN